jgi:hypothetical protein
MFKTCGVPGDSLWFTGVFTQRLFSLEYLSSVFPGFVLFFINKRGCLQTTVVPGFPTLSTRHTKKNTYINKLILGGV